VPNPLKSILQKRRLELHEADGTEWGHTKTTFIPGARKTMCKGAIKSQIFQESLRRSEPINRHLTEFAKSSVASQFLRSERAPDDDVVCVPTYTTPINGDDPARLNGFDES
jgi:hypothetical protein